MIVTISEDLNRGKRDSLRFCATAEGKEEQGGFGSSSHAALWSLAKALNVHPATLMATATIERVAVR